ncbi:hypothetical protein [uncultured Jatrophihabitans sp.]|uniref:hypothetical protein n=1 Tax=uncultured Jatrophihabitans sp. TaxID=1610747 RepID=UPI0035CA813C
MAVHGSDHAAGTVGHPMRTVHAALARLHGGGSVELRGGTYHRRITLAHVRDVTLRPYRHEHVVLSGAGLHAPKGFSAMVQIRDSRNVTVRGLDVTAYRTKRRGVVPIGIYVHGHDHGVRIAGNHVHDLGNDNGTLGSFDINAHGIAVYGDDPDAAVSGLHIVDNTVDRLHLGASETVVVNGNVDGWDIARNHIFDDNNIGIDAIGFEPTLGGKNRYTQRNRARNGHITRNVVSGIKSRGNPAYWEGDGWCNCADGIYVDGGTHIDIRDNKVSTSDIGIEVAAENPRGAADHVRVLHNRIRGSLYVGLTTGGYCNGADACGGVNTGKSFDNLFADNDLRDDNGLNDGSPELLVQYYASRDVFEHNTITATNTGGVVYGTVPDAQAYTGPDANRSDHNAFAVAKGHAVQFGWNGHVYGSFAAYRQATHQDAHSRLVFRA